jgi:hypothetical protein
VAVATAEILLMIAVVILPLITVIDDGDVVGLQTQTKI